MLLDDNFTPRLVDFGLVSAAWDLPEALAYLHTTARQPGAIRWAAPEHFLVGDIKRTTKGDIYSLGNIIVLVSPPFRPRMLYPSPFPGIVGKIPVVGSTS